MCVAPIVLDMIVHSVPLSVQAHLQMGWGS